MDRLEKYALEFNIPIMQKDGIEFLMQYIKDNNVRSILEIGTAIGYSAINMALVNDEIKVTTIERDSNLYNIALDNISSYNLADRITVINADALDISVDGKYDLIFIDAAKAQYIKFFEKYKGNLNSDGVIISDNLNFHGLVYRDDIESKSLRGLVRKINNYREFLVNNKEFITKFIDLGDGIAISKLSNFN